MPPPKHRLERIQTGGMGTRRSGHLGQGQSATGFRSQSSAGCFVSAWHSAWPPRAFLAEGLLPFESFVFKLAVTQFQVLKMLDSLAVQLVSFPLQPSWTHRAEVSGERHLSCSHTDRARRRTGVASASQVRRVKHAVCCRKPCTVLNVKAIPIAYYERVSIYF